jgi:hypothetical protein
MRKYLTIYEEAVSHVWLCNRSLLNFLIYEENLIFFFYQCSVPNAHPPPSPRPHAGQAKQIVNFN